MLFRVKHRKEHVKKDYKRDHKRTRRLNDFYKTLLRPLSGVRNRLNVN